jgi:membrane protein required for colicin V production
MILAGVAGRIVRWMMRKVGLSGLDRALGAALGLVRGALIVAVVLTGMTAFTPTSKWLEGSQYAPYFLVVGRAAVWIAPAQLRSQFYQGLQLLRRQEQPAGLKSPTAQ